MSAAQFEGEGPVGRYWLANCEGFAVKGDAHGVVKELIHDSDSLVPTRLVVRTRSRRRMIVPADTVTSVVPASKVLVVERRRERRHTLRPARPVAAASVVSARAARAVVPTAHAAGKRVVATAGPPSKVAAAAARRQTVVLARESWRLSRPALAMLVSSLGMLALEVRGSARLVPAHAARLLSNLAEAGLGALVFASAVWRRIVESWEARRG
jgi:hypothetical protein